MMRFALAFALTAALASTAGAQQPSGDGQPADQPPGVTPTTAGPTQLTPAEMEALREIEIDFKRWENAANGHHNRIRQILFREYEDRKLQLERRYAERIEAAEKDERTRRLGAARVDHREVVLGQQAGGGIDLSSRESMPDRVGDLAVVAQPFESPLV